MAFRWQRRIVLAAAVVAMAGCAVENVAAYGGVDLQVVDRESGAVMEQYPRGGRTFVAGEAGARYALRVSNRSVGRVLVVLTVDGVNIVSGETGAWNQVGYVLEPFQSYDLNGWRKSDHQIAAFEFTGPRNSYAVRTGRPANVGVIGMAVFAEKPRRVEPEQPPVSSLRRDSASRMAAAPSASAEAQAGAANEGADASNSAGAARMAQTPQSPAMKLGTGHGAREWSSTRRVAFERASANPYMVVSVEYDSYDNLVAAGVIPVRRTSTRAFPGSTAAGYVQDPPR